MSAADVTRSIAIVTACMCRDGTPTFVRTDVNVTPEEIENGVHYYLVEGKLLQAGYEEPMVHFSEDEAPAFLFPAVKECLAVASAVQNLALSEKS